MTVVLTAVVSFVVIFWNPLIQSLIASSVAGKLSRELNTEIEFNSLHISYPLCINIKDVYIADENHDTLASIENMEARISMRSLTNKVRITNMRLDGLNLNLVRDKNRRFNYSFLMDYLSEDDTVKTVRQGDRDFNVPFPIEVDNMVVKNSSVIYWDQKNDKGTDPLLMNYMHLIIRDINFNITDFKMLGDSIFGNIRQLSAEERSGFKIDRFSTEAVVSPRGFRCDNLITDVGKSHVECDVEMSYPHYPSVIYFNDSVFVDGNIKEGTELYLYDIACFATDLYDMPDLLRLKGKAKGYVRNFESKDFEFWFGNGTHFRGDVSMTGLPYFFSTHSKLIIKDMEYSMDDIFKFGIPYGDGLIPIPQSFASLNRGQISGSFSGTYYNFDTDLSITSDAGDISCSLAYLEDAGTFECRINGNEVDYGIFTGSNMPQHVTLELAASGSIPINSDVELGFNGRIESVEIADNTLGNISLSGNLKNRRLDAGIAIADSKLRGDVEGSADFMNREPVYEFTSNVRLLDLARLNIYDNGKNMKLATAFAGTIEGDDLAAMTGNIRFDTTTVTTNRGRFVMDSLLLNIKQNRSYPQIFNVNCDFFDLEAGGVVDLHRIGNSFESFVNDYIHLSSFDVDEFADSRQDFYINVFFKDSGTLTDLLLPDLSVEKGSLFTCNYTPLSNDVGFSFSSDEVRYKGLKSKGLNASMYYNSEVINVNVTSDDFVFKEPTENDSTTFGIERLDIDINIGGDSLYTDIAWDDYSKLDINKGDLRCSFRPYDDGGRMSILSSDITIENKKWRVKRNGYVEFADKRTRIHDLEVRNNKQVLGIEGYYPKNADDSLRISINSFDINTFDPLMKSFMLNVGGVLNGNIMLSDLKKNATIEGNVLIDNLAINSKQVGNADIASSWNKNKAALQINADIVNGPDTLPMLSLSGNYYPRITDNLSFGLNLNRTAIDIFEPFMTGLVSNVSGTADGRIAISGSLEKPIFEGTLNLNDAQCKVDYLNTNYTFSHPIRISENRIEFNNLILYDNEMNTAIANGMITHDYLKDFNFDISILPRYFMGMNTTEVDNPYYYGSIKATGEVKITGPLENLNMSINARTDDGTRFVLPTDYVSTLRENDYINFVNKNEEEETPAETRQEVIHDTGDIFTMDIIANVNDNAEVSILLPANIGTLNAKGSGNLIMNMNATEDISLVGDYVISSGKFLFSPLNMVMKKSFDLMDGGVISWTGDPLEASINVNGLYKTKASLATLGLSIDSTTTTSTNVTVNCIINLSGLLTNPDVKFRIELPNASEDISQAVFTQIDTTSQSIILEQVLSLLVLSSFTNTSTNMIGGNNFIGSGINMITGQINSWISQISKDLDINFRYTSNNYTANEEMEVGVKTDLFNNRLTIEGNLGVINNQNNQNVQNYSNIVGDVNISYLITPDGRLKATAYSHSNTNTNYYIYTYDNYSPYTQGLGLSYTREFNRLKDLFKKKKTNKRYEEHNEINNEFNEKLQGL